MRRAAHQLVDAGFHTDAPAFFAWLGETMYLQRETVMAMLKTIASLPRPSGVVFDYGIDRCSVFSSGSCWTNSPGALPQPASRGRRSSRRRSPNAISARVGFSEIEDLGPDDINARYFRIAATA